MKKFTIIIPTLWNAKEIYSTVSMASKCKLVGEVIIIDNAPDKNRKRINNKKVKTVSKGGNIYVNRSWNIGVNMAKHDRICICNDDITFDLTKTLSFLKEINLKQMGLIGCVRMKHDSGGDIELEKVDKFIASGFGVLMFIHKDNYKEIPTYCKIWWGDYWLFKTTEPQYVIKNIGLTGKYKTSVSNFKITTEMDTFYKYTKMEPKIKLKEEKKGSTLYYLKVKLKCYFKYFFHHIPKRIYEQI